MSFNVTTAHVQSYKANVEYLLQQRETRLSMCVDVRSDYVGKSVKAIEQIGLVEAQERLVRHGDVTPVNTPHAARWVKPRDWELPELVDDTDKLRMLFDPTSYYAQNFRHAMNRRKDRTIIDAFFGSALTGEDGLTAEAFDTTNQQIVSSSVGLTVLKLITAREKLRAAEVPEDEPLYVAVTAAEETDLLNEIQIISKDFNDHPVLANGRIERFLGFNFIHTELLTLRGSERQIPAWCKSGIHLGVWKDVATSVDKVPTKGLTWQVYTCATFNATRTQNKKVVEILCA